MLKISEIRVKLVEDRSERLQAFCTVTFADAFVVRDIKIIDGQRGPFVAMPSRKLMDRCPRCRTKNHLRAKFCNECGLSLPPGRFERDPSGRPRLHTDIAHPIHAAARQAIEDAVLEAFRAELERSKMPGYVPPAFDDIGGDDYDPPARRAHSRGSDGREREQGGA